jgi:IMP dehydrogenase
MNKSGIPKLTQEGITFDDLLLSPGYTDFKRHDVDVSVQLTPHITLRLPVFSSPMDTVTEEAMAKAIGNAGGMGIIHRNLSVASQSFMVANVKREKLTVGAAVGLGADFEHRVKALIRAQADVIVIDSGHGYTTHMVDALRQLKKIYPHQAVMAGNIATVDGAKALVAAGADILRVGMGPGSICTTRIVTGMGVPQATAIVQAVKGVKGTKVTIVADGGIRQIGDMAKAFGLGAHAVMLGGLLAGFDESPGEITTVDSRTYKHYRGMGSIGAMKRGSAERYGQYKDVSVRKLIPEGVEGLVPYKGTVGDYLDQVKGSMQSAFYYIGAKTMRDFHKKARFIRVTPAGMAESHPHDVLIGQAGGNYTR